MMRSEFIERTGFEPTADEYAQINQEYMGCDIDKDQFCKEWKKNGGIQRLTRMRVSRIEELEHELETVRRVYEEQLKAKDAEIEKIARERDGAIQLSLNDAHALADSKEEVRQLRRKMEVLKEAFNILREESEAK